MRQFLPRIGLALLASLSLAANCGGDVADSPATVTINGNALLNREGRVRARLVNETRSIAGEFETDGKGNFSFPAKRGSTYILEASGGTYTDIATSLTMEMGTTRLYAIVADIDPEGDELPVSIDAATHWTYSEALYLMERQHISLAEAYKLAATDINNWLGCEGGGDVVRAKGIDPSVPSSGDPLEAIQAGLLAGALSYQAKLISEHENLTPGRQFNGKTMLFQYADDLQADGQLDGRGSEGQLYVARFPLSAATARGARNGLAHGLSEFLSSPQNKTGLNKADVRGFMECLSTAKGALFAKAAPSLNAYDEGPAIRVTTSSGPEILPNAARGVIYFDVSAQHVLGVDSILVRLDAEEGQLSPESISPSMARYRLDTTTLVDGEHVLDVVATTRGFEPRAHRHYFMVDNTRSAPTLNMRSSLFREERQGLKPEYAASPEVHLDWGARAEHPVTDIAHLNFSQIESDAPFPVFEKYYNRLDYLPDVGLDEVSQNLPVFQFVAADCDTPADQILVEYRYVFNGSLQRDWTSLHQASGVYTLPFSYQTMLPLNLLADPDRARRENFIARSKPEDIHTVEVRAADQTGNSSVKRFNFHLDLMSPPVALRHCQLTDRTTNLSMDALNLHEAYDNLPHRVKVGQILWLTDLDAQSLAPRDSLRIEIGGGQISTTLEQRKLAIYRLGPSKGKAPSCGRGAYNDGCVKWSGDLETPVRITYRSRGAQRNATAADYVHFHGESYLFEEEAGTPGAKESERVLMMDGLRNYHVYSAINDHITGPAGELFPWQAVGRGYSTTWWNRPYSVQAQRNVTWVEGDEYYDEAKASELFYGVAIRVNGYSLANASSPEEQRLPQPSSLQIDATCMASDQHRTLSKHVPR